MNTAVRRPSRRTTLLLTAVALAATAGCGSANTTAPTGTDGDRPTITLTNCGETVKLAKPAQRAVTTEQSATETLLALGLADRIAGTSNLKTRVAPEFADAYAKLKVITPKVLTPEQTLSVNPDLVFSPFVDIMTKDRVGTRAELASKGVATYLSEVDCPADKRTITNPIEGMYADYRNLGTLFGVPDRADKLIADQKKSVEEATAKPTGKAPKILWVYATYSGSPYAAGGTGLAQAMTETVGGVNPLSELKENWPEVAWEKLGETDPDLIVIADLAERGKPGDSAESKIADLRKNPATAKLDAVQKNRFLVVPGVETDATVRFPHTLKALHDELVKLELVH
ncbi:Vitamin B12-binding protein [Austwickia sp. TVS 96-490-7B]|uniref:ABC transporter substrate-binding protein n=1 Tax=Austwickia sp. TVS 96-490-7B TaxID=2830843 RepID=UPI001C57E2BF|nr:ABC transporter substrate-binding protein [Austwickia sp. TVS 96-490-7B]MBW3084863.1 Vitamin B12-binding protein [Austwickia sp. TVS 96-490-7B]